MPEISVDPLNSKLAAQTPAGAPARHSLSFAWKTILAVMFLLNLALLVPWRPSFPRDGPIDVSWSMALQWAFKNHARFGRDIVFTYGPWGFIWSGFDPATHRYILLGWGLIATAFFAGLTALARRLTRRWWLGALWMLAPILLAGSDVLQIRDVTLFALAILLLFIHFHVDDRPVSGTKFLLAFALGFATLVKFSVAFLALPILLLITLQQTIARRRPWLIAIYLLSAAAFWLLAGQRLADFGAFLRYSVNIVGGYAQGEAVSSPHEHRDVLIFVAFAAMFVLVFAVAHGRNFTRLRALLFITGLMIALLVTFKVGYVRHDLHELPAVTMLTMTAFFCAAVLWPMFRRSMFRILPWVLIVSCVLFNWYSCMTWGEENADFAVFIAHPLLTLPNVLKFAANSLMDKTAITTLYDEDLQAARQHSQSFASIKGRVDLYPWEQWIVFSNGLNADPRPTLQSYLAYTPELERLNAEHLRGPSSPDLVLFQINRIDLHYPAQEDALCWPELLSRYVPQKYEPPMLTLTRRPRPSSYSFTPLGSSRQPMNQWVAVPQSDDPIWATIELRPTPLGKLCELLYKPANLSLTVATHGGDIERFRLVPRTAAAGFLLSPRIMDAGEFALLGSTDGFREIANNTVTQIRVSPADGDGSPNTYDSEFRIAFSSLRFEHWDFPMPR